MTFKITNKEAPIINKQEFLIKEVDATYKPLIEENIFYEDAKTKQLFYKKPFSFAKARDWKYYAVNLEKTYEYVGFQKQLQSLDRSLETTLIINLKYQFSQNLNLDFLRKALAKGANDTIIIENYLNGWIEEFDSSTSNFINKFYTLESKFIDHIIKEAKAIGIRIELTTKLKGDDIEELSTVEGKVLVRSKDYFGKTKLKYSVDFEIINAEKSKALQALSKANHVQKSIERNIKATIVSKDITLSDLHFETNTKVRNTLENELTPVLNKDGLKLTFLNIETETDKKPLIKKEIKYSIESTTKDNHSVVIDHVLRFTLEDLGKYYSSGIKDIELWVKDRLKGYTQDYIFQQEFTDLVIGFDDTTIKTKIEDAAKKVGYQIKQLVVLPDLQKIIPKHIDFEIGEDYEFSTKLDELKVKLNIIISGNIKDVSKIAWLIGPNTTSEFVLQKIKGAVLKEMRQYMHTINPEDFYMRFNVGTNEYGKPIAEELQEKIRAKLKGTFGILDADVICKQLGTDLQKQLQSLRGVTYPIHIESKSGEIKFKYLFYVNDVDSEGWTAFKVKCDGLRGRDAKELLKDIANRVKIYAESRLDEFSYDYRSVKSIDFQGRLAGFVVEGIRETKQEFGLSITLSKSIERLANSLEIELRNQKEQQQANDNKIMKKLEEQRIKKTDALLEQELKHFGDKYIDDEKGIEEELDELKKGVMPRRNLEDDITKLEETNSYKNLEDIENTNQNSKN